MNKVYQKDESETLCFAARIGGTLLVPPRRVLFADPYKMLEVN